ncbi:hypothetical protein LCGC14_1404460 [marine sediment metagenome]|uniref:Uncharacterized protein n=1 Tax=marine sediment metagenome TaxID=412755 RepID=A0A0F9JWE3_9ZZZZ
MKCSNKMLLKDLKCIMCDEEIDDEGRLFCSKCRNKDVFKRITAFRKTEYYGSLIGRGIYTKFKKTFIRE